VTALDLTCDQWQSITRALAHHDARLAQHIAMQLKPPTNTHGGGRDQTAVIGHAPEHADWKPGDETYPVEIHATARVEPHVLISAGYAQPTRIGARSWLLAGAHVGHDAQIGEDVKVTSQAVIGGHVTIGDRAFIGLNATIAPFRSIGDDAIVEMGAVVIHDVPAGARVGGNPARILPPRRADRFTDRPQAEREADTLPGFEGEELAGQPRSVIFHLENAP